MATRTVFLSLTAFYVLFRFVVLSSILIVTLTQSDVGASGGTAGIVVAATAGGLVVVVLILQLIVTGSEVLLAPLRVAAFLQLLGTVMFLPGAPGLGATGLGSASSLVAVAGSGAGLMAIALVLAAVDSAVFIFLLSYRPVGKSPATAEPAGDAELPDISVEELEE